jgi:hypothetical protein
MKIASFSDSILRSIYLLVLLTGFMHSCVRETPKSISGYLYPIKSGEKWGYMDSTGNIIIPPQFQKATDYFISGYSEFKQNDKSGFIDSTGRIAIPANYDELTYFWNGIAWAKTSGHWGAIDERNNTIIPFLYDTISNNMELQPMLIRKAGQWIFINMKGEQVFTPDYDKVKTFSDSRALAKKNGLYGYINKKGEWAIPAEYEEAEDFFGEKTIVYQDGSYYIIDTTGKEKLKISYYIAEQTNRDFAKVFTGDKYGVINMEGKLIFDTVYDELGPYFVNGYSWGWKNGHCYILSDKGKTILLSEIDRIWMFDNGAATIQKEHQYGFCDTTGRVVMKNISDFSEGLAATNESNDIGIRGPYGYIDFSGKLVIPYQFSEAFPFRYGLARVEIEGKMAYINKTGKIIWKED